METGRGLWGGYGTDPYSYGQQTIHKHILKGAGTVDGEYQKGVYLNISYPYAINKISASSNTVFSENLSAPWYWSFDIFPAPGPRRSTFDIPNRFARSNIWFIEK